MSSEDKRRMAIDKEPSKGNQTNLQYLPSHFGRYLKSMNKLLLIITMRTFHSRVFLNTLPLCRFLSYTLLYLAVLCFILFVIFPFLLSNCFILSLFLYLFLLLE